VTCCPHSGYHFALLDETRYCQCNSCGMQWCIFLGKRVQFRDSEETDSIANAMTGLEYIEKARRAVRVVRR
jgi:hypothetical protein